MHVTCNVRVLRIVSNDTKYLLFHLKLFQKTANNNNNNSKPVWRIENAQAERVLNKDKVIKSSPRGEEERTFGLRAGITEIYFDRRRRNIRLATDHGTFPRREYSKNSFSETRRKKLDMRFWVCIRDTHRFHCKSFQKTANYETSWKMKMHKHTEY